MAETRTQDNQKVFNSATANIQSFLNGVKNVSSTKNMTTIYNNMGELFDTFTRGTLLKQGANSEQVLRTIYRQLNDDYLTILQDSNAVKNIVEAIKSKQEKVQTASTDGQSGQGDSASVAAPIVTQTTYKVVKKELDPLDFDINDVILDFIDELQTAILEVKQKLVRECERVKAQYIALNEKKSEPQPIPEPIKESAPEPKPIQDDSAEQVAQIDNIDKQISEQQQSIEVEKQRKLEQIKNLQKQIAVFETGTGEDKSLSEISTTIQKDKGLQQISIKDSSKFDVKKLIQQIQQSINKKQEQQNGKVENTAKTMQPMQKQTTQMQKQTTQTTIVKKVSKQPEKISAPLKPVSNNVQNPNKTDTKIQVAPTKVLKKQQIISSPRPVSNEQNGTKISKGAKINNPLDNKKNNKGAANVSENDISSGKVSTTLQKINDNVISLLKDSKFRKNFTMQYQQIQKTVKKQLGRVDKDEKLINKYFKQTEKEIKNIRKGNKSKGILGLVMNPMNWLGLVWVVIGGLILITLIRMALKKWKDTFMPKPDPEGGTLFGIQIPFLAEIKAFGTGIWNTITVGLPNLMTRLSGWFEGVNEMLFGEGGMFETWEDVKLTIGKIIGAIIIAKTKEAGGKLVKFILGLLNIPIPGAGLIAVVITEMCEQIYTFITCELMLLITGAMSDANKTKQSMEQKAAEAQKNLMKKKPQAAIRSGLKRASHGVSAFVPAAAIPGLATPHPDTPGMKRQSGKPGAIITKIAKKTKNNQEEKNKQQEIQADADKEKSDAKFDKQQEDAASILRQLQFAADSNSTDRAHNSIIARFITPNIDKLDKYIKFIGTQKNKWSGVKGNLYDMDTGWNPGYIVGQGDLFSVIPNDPFEPIHDERDIQIGVPSQGGSTYKGIKPFTWIQNGVEVESNPYAFELSKAYGIRSLWSSLGEWVAERRKTAEEKSKSWWFGGTRARWFNEETYEMLPGMMKSFGKQWIDELYVTRIKSSDKTVNFNGKFLQFHRNLQDGLINDDANNLKDAQEGKTSQNKPFRIPTPESYDNKAGFTYDEVVKEIDAEDAETPKKKKPWWMSDKQFKELQKKDREQRIKDRIAKKEGDRKKFVEGIIEKYSKMSFNGINYGLVREMMFKDGVLKMLSGTNMFGPVAKASTLTRLLSCKLGSIPKPESSKGQSWMYDLIYDYMNFHNISGFDWDTLKSASYTHGAISQSLIEYFLYNVMPQWNVVEKLLADVVTRDGENDKPLLEGLNKLTELLTEDSIFTFLGQHLRVRNMKVIVVDEQSATERERELIAKYKKKLNIPSAEEKIKILAALGQEHPQTKEEIEARFNKLAGLLERAKYEAAAIGDSTYVNQLMEFFNHTKKQMEGVQQDGDNIAQQPGKITKLVEPPAKTEEQLRAEAEEKKKREEEARKAEAERKQKEEEERKKKEEEAKKRAEELAIAKAKIAAMEAIKKQEQKYETILEKMIADPGKVTDEELKSLGDDVKTLKQEAENNIAKLPREEREMKLALIRGDKISPKTFSEIKETAIGLHGSLQGYIEEVNKIPCGSIIALQNASMPNKQPIKQIDTDNIDLGE